MTIFDLAQTFPSINGLKEDSFARFTIRHRLPAIVDGIIRDNEFEPDIEANLEEFKHEIHHGRIGDLIVTGPDTDRWNSWLAPFRKFTWFEAPFYFVEAYFYRLLMDKIGFFRHIMILLPFKRRWTFKTILIPLSGY